MKKQESCVEPYGRHDASSTWSHTGGSLKSQVSNHARCLENHICSELVANRGQKEAMLLPHSEVQ